MNPQSLVLPKQSHAFGFGLRAALFLAALLAVFALLLPLAWNLHGAAGLQAMAVAWAMIAVPNLIAAAIDVRLAAPRQAVWRLAVSGVVRTGWPLAALLALLIKGTDLEAAGFVYFVLAFYIAALMVEVGCLARESRGLQPAASR